ncbi:MetQ/NlpA family ABC transporter substrate-binding protein [Paenibacillus sp. MMS20-IR301]|uniref:MetQ/NlpA family ABC transporter substrate-binding protein n=1 Tax=Paenibacillus sp. MMS20-IR301 TaxID=2895946 RepID=UPI0028E8D2CC|nr:MetQ/NlpA family ABC transporter substrate-binding protein [Paenibacillus sp. MMS20-IR301]WNS43056.1 MetQ/NlpA family ABC transporter substrate-binding protein [Paenibacillus sp. MMS20-IR301]
MKTTTKAAFLLTLLVLVLALAGCGQGNNKEAAGTPAAGSTEPVKIKVASLIPPMTDILDIVQPILKEQGVDMEIVILSDNVQPNEALANKEVDANFFQHLPYMEQFNASKGANLVGVQPVYDAIYGGYSKRYKAIADLPDGATLVMANDPSNIGRSLQMFADAGLITLKDGVGIQATQADITANPKNYKFEEVDLLMLARMLDDADLVAMTPAYASPLGLTPKKDALITEGEDSAFTITLVAREDNKDADAIRKLARAISGPEVKKFLEDNYADIALPAF